MRRTAEDRKAELIDELAAARKSVQSALDGIPPDAIDEPFIGVWCVKDLLAHLIGWDLLNLQGIREILSGGRPSFFKRYDHDWETVNRSLVERYRKDSLNELRRDAETSHHALVAFLQSIPAKQLLTGKSPSEMGRTVTLRNLIRAEAGDERAHERQIRAFLEQRREINARV
jgi:hypothetical protein